MKIHLFLFSILCPLHAYSKKAAKVWRDEIMKGGINQAFQNSQAKSKEETMRERLRRNPMDDEANKYFGEQIQKKNVEDQ